MMKDVAILDLENILTEEEKNVAYIFLYYCIETCLVGCCEEWIMKWKAGIKILDRYVCL